MARNSRLSVCFFEDADLVFLPDPLAETDNPPADHAVQRRDRAVLDHRRKRCALFVIEPRRLAGREPCGRSVPLDRAR